MIITVNIWSFTIVHTGLMKIYSRAFPGLYNKIQAVHFFGHLHYCVTILHILHSQVNKPILVSANNVLKPKGNSYSDLCIKNHCCGSILRLVQFFFKLVYFFFKPVCFFLNQFLFFFNQFIFSKQLF